MDGKGRKKYVTEHIHEMRRERKKGREKRRKREKTKRK